MRSTRVTTILTCYSDKQIIIENTHERDPSVPCILTILCHFTHPSIRNYLRYLQSKYGNG
jgi:hypothetical protein